MVDVAKVWFLLNFVFFIVFLVSCFIVFFMGIFWGIFVIMIFIVVFMVKGMGVDVYMIIVVVLGGGVFGDYCLLIFDMIIFLSMAFVIDYIDYVWI